MTDHTGETTTMIDLDALEKLADEAMNPGSAEAIKAGCTCPRMDNANGRGIPSPDGTLFYYASDCPLHHHGDFPLRQDAPRRNGKGRSRTDATKAD